MCRALILYVAAGALVEALAALRNAKQPDTAAVFLLACHEAKMKASASRTYTEPEVVPSNETRGENFLDLPGDLSRHGEEVQAVYDYYGQYQRLLAHTCTGVTAVVD